MATEKAWQTKGWPLISITGHGLEGKRTGPQEMAVEMLVIHNILIRTMNSIYLQCVNVEKSPEVVPDFVQYASLWGTVVEHHHHEEEENVFPEIETQAGKPGLMAGNVEQHHAFHPGLEDYNKFFKDILAEKAKYDGQKLKTIIESFMPILAQHLKEEIQTLLDLAKYENVDWAVYWDKTSKEILKKHMADPLTMNTLLPFMLTGNDATFENGVLSWPIDMPWVAKLFFRFWYIPVHKSWWRFAPCDGSSTPKDLPFA